MRKLTDRFYNWLLRRTRPRKRHPTQREYLETRARNKAAEATARKELNAHRFKQKQERLVAQRKADQERIAQPDKRDDEWLHSAARRRRAAAQ